MNIDLAKINFGGSTSGSGQAHWGGISGDITDQEDLMNLIDDRCLEYDMDDHSDDPVMEDFVEDYNVIKEKFGKDLVLSYNLETALDESTKNMSYIRVTPDNIESIVKEYELNDVTGEYELIREQHYEPYYIGEGWDAVPLRTLSADPGLVRDNINYGPVDLFVELEEWTVLGVSDIVENDEDKYMSFSGLKIENNIFGLYTAAPVFDDGVFDAYKEDFSPLMAYEINGYSDDPIEEEILAGLVSDYDIIKKNPISGGRDLVLNYNIGIGGDDSRHLSYTFVGDGGFYREEKVYELNDVTGEYELTKDMSFDLYWCGEGWGAVPLRTLSDDPDIIENNIDTGPVDLYMQIENDTVLGVSDIAVEEIGGGQFMGFSGLKFFNGVPGLYRATPIFGSEGDFDDYEEEFRPLVGAEEPDPTIDQQYILQATVLDGNITYEWVPYNPL